MRVLLIGGGAREHALAARILESPLLTKLYWLPGNAALEGQAEKVTNLDPCSVPEVADWARLSAVDLAVIGPEAPLLAGVSDCLEEAGIPCFGPSRAAARLEGSKAFAKELMTAWSIPTARYVKVAGPREAAETVARWGAPVVIKADGLAAGKGVTVAMTGEEARQAALTRSGPAVIEEYLEGEELSFMVLAQGRRWLPLVPSRDYKRIGAGDTGPNTGGMGAVASFALLGGDLHEEIGARIIAPVLAAMAEAGTPFKGVLYAGLMLTGDGPKVLEFNARFGDPETQAILQLWQDDLLAVLAEVARGGLPEKLTWSREEALCLVLASGGYPGPFRRGYPIQGLAAAARQVKVYHGGTELRQGQAVTAGGRVLTLAAAAESLALVRERVYAAARTVAFTDMYYRTDIGAGF